MTADIVFRTVGMQRDLPPHQNRQQVLFLDVSRASNRSRVAKPVVVEKMRLNCASAHWAA